MADQEPQAHRLFPPVRYPGGKRAMLRFLSEFLPKAEDLPGRYIEPFVGGAAVFLYVNPRQAVLADSNKELIDLYAGLRADPLGVWALYESFASTKEEYLSVRAKKALSLGATERAARLLYLNRTCFKGNWRHNAEGEFTVGYGGQSRRWVITKQLIVDVAQALVSAELLWADFEDTIREAAEGDFLFLDPPYKPGHRELQQRHYGSQRFEFADHRRLAKSLSDASDRRVSWCLTTSAHPDITGLFPENRIMPVPRRGQGIVSGEVVVLS